MLFNLCNIMLKYLKSLDTCIFCLYIILIGGIILYYSYGIYVLAEEYDNFLIISKNCDSKLWYYGLCSIIAFTDKILLRIIQSISTYSYIYYLMFLIEILLVIFGSIELWNKKCIYKYISKKSDLYIFCIINLSLQLIVSFFLLIKIILMNKYIENKHENNINNINNQNNINNKNYMTNEEYIDSSSNDYNENNENNDYNENNEYNEYTKYTDYNENNEYNEYTKYNGYNEYNENNKQCTDV